MGYTKVEINENSRVSYNKIPQQVELAIPSTN